MRLSLCGVRIGLECGGAGCEQGTAPHAEGHEEAGPLVETMRCNGDPGCMQDEDPRKKHGAEADAREVAGRRKKQGDGADQEDEGGEVGEKEVPRDPGGDHGGDKGLVLEVHLAEDGHGDGKEHEAHVGQNPEGARESARHGGGGGLAGEQQRGAGERECLKGARTQAAVVEDAAEVAAVQKHRR